jgi:hypothetical protein
MHKDNKKKALQAALINLLVINQIMTRLVRLIDQILNEDN